MSPTMLFIVVIVPLLQFAEGSATVVTDYPSLLLFHTPHPFFSGEEVVESIPLPYRASQMF